MKLFNLTNSQIVIGQNDQSKSHLNTGKKNHPSPLGCVQNNVSKMIGWPFWWLFKMGYFLLISWSNKPWIPRVRPIFGNVVTKGIGKRNS
jgi:hypothetical protein